MITHSVQFNRPLSGAILVDEPFRNPSSFDQSGSAVSSDETGAHSDDGNNSQTQTRSEAIETLLSEISTGVRQHQTRTDHCVTEMQSLSLRLAKMIVTQVVGSSDGMKVERVEHLLNFAMSRPETPIVALVHPEDFSMLREYLDSVEMEVRQNASVERGECRIDFSSHELVSNLQQQLDQIEDRLWEELKDA